MSPPRRPASPGSGRRGDDASSGALPRAGRSGRRDPGASTSPRGVRGATPRSGAVPRVGGSRPGTPRSGSRSGTPRPGTPAAGTARPAATARPGTRLPVPRMFTVRAMVLALVVLLAFVLVYPTLATYVEARAEVEQLRAARDAARAENANLEAELRRWEDDAYIIAQARERLSFVMPGETAFRVVDPEIVPDEPAEGPGPVTSAVDGSTRPWYSTVWESVRVAGELGVDGTAPAGPDVAGQGAADPAAPAADGAPADPTGGDRDG